LNRGFDGLILVSERRQNAWDRQKAGKGVMKSACVTAGKGQAARIETTEGRCRQTVAVPAHGGLNDAGH
jgi:hypothetical protein